MSRTDFIGFTELARSGVIVPVHRELPADMETPLSILKRFENEENVFLLESVEAAERIGRYSFMGVRPKGIFKIENGKAYYQNEIMEHKDYPLDALKSIVSEKRVAGDGNLPPLPGGAVGFIAYEGVNMFEILPSPQTKLRTPEAVFMITDEIIAFDNIRHTMKLIVSVHTDEFSSLKEAYDYGIKRLDELEETIMKPCHCVMPEAALNDVRLESTMSRNEFCDMVEKARRLIHDGEIIQVVLSQRFDAKLECEPFTIYRALRHVNPSPYTFFLKLGELTLVGSSPETLVKLSDGRSSLRPIAGTRKRGANDSEDRIMADELLKDEKERAEHLMLVDLGRNDLGRTAEPGSVRVKSFMGVERYSHVMHLVSDVEGTLKKDCDAFDLLKTTFPAGTLSGAPKIRAMEIINELEKESRGVYGGSVGYISYDGNMDMAITIRTIETGNGMLHIQAGAGIVYDSVPEKEYEETLNKASALFKAVKLAANGLKI